MTESARKPSRLDRFGDWLERWDARLTRVAVLFLFVTALYIGARAAVALP